MADTSKFTGRVAVITGGARGIGRACCRLFARNGASVAIADIDRKAGQAVADELQASGAKACYVAVDVTNPESATQMAMQARDQLGPVSILVNNAGIYLHPRLRIAPFDQISFAEWREVLDINLMGVVHCTHALLPQLRASGHGTIVNMSSAVPFSGVPGYAHYAASKAALIGLSNVLARELGPEGLRVNCVAPGLVMTEEEQTPDVIAYHEMRASSRPVRRIETAEDVAESVVFLASPGSGFVTGQVVVVDGGMALRG